MVKGRSWRKVAPQSLEAIRALLIQAGGKEDKSPLGQHESWRVRNADVVWTAYDTGTLYCNGGEAPELGFHYDRVSELVGERELPSEISYFVGLDETGKGEVLGHATVGIVLAERRVLPRLTAVLGTANTKIRKEFSYWDGLLKELDGLRPSGLEYYVETLPPWDVDRYNVNKILDVVYQRLIARVIQGKRLGAVKITIDDYGIGRNLGLFLSSLHAGGGSIAVEAKADENYPEVRAASVVAKWRRELAMSRISQRFSFPDQPLGSGNAGDPVTIAWLNRWKATGQAWPWFVKRSFRTIRELDGVTGDLVKESPPIRHELLSEEAARLFREGKLSSASLTIVCPECGATATGAKLTPTHDGKGLIGRCLSCSEPIKDLGTTLRYYSGAALPDTSVLLSGAISADLDQHGFFGGYTLFVPEVVRLESDTAGGRKELGRLGDFSAMGRITLERLGGEVPSDPANRDAAVIEIARRSASILVTRDGGMYGLAEASKLFCLAFRTAPPAKASPPSPSPVS